MKSIVHLLISGIVILVYCTSCTESVELDFSHNPQLTFNCILNPDSTINASLNESKKLGAEEQFEAIEGAEIKLFESDQLLGEMTDNGNGNYSLSYKPKKGFSYRVEIEKEGYAFTAAQTTVPKGANIEFISKDCTEEKCFLEIEIDDNAGENYYWYYSYSINKNLNYKYVSQVYSNYSVYFDGFNKKVEPETGNGYYYAYMVRIKDGPNDGGILSWQMPIRVDDRYDDYRVIIETDEHYDRYLKSSVQIRMLENESIPLNEPVQIYSNVENGYGIFGANLVKIHKS